jgi:hypothetical protein
VDVDRRVQSTEDVPRPATRSASWIDAANPLEIVGLSNNELRASYFVGYYL